MHRVHLDQLYRLFPQVMKKRLSIGATRLKPYHDLFKPVFSAKLLGTMPKIVEALCTVRKKKWLSFLPIGGSEVTNVKAFTNIDCYNHRSRVDSFDFLGFTGIHGYTPLLIFANQLATGLSQDEYSLFHSTARLTAI
jgi:hypothetical protein